MGAHSKWHITFRSIDYLTSLPQEPIQTIAAAPFPYSALAPGYYGEPSLASDEMQEALEAKCAAAKVEDVPEYWTTDGWSDDSAEWLDFVPAVGSSRSWELERSEHFLGSPVPLLYHSHYRVTIFKAGGLLFLYSAGSGGIWVMRYGALAADVARAYEIGDMTLYVAMVACEPLTYAESEWYLAMWQWETSAFGRNRWAELAERGGEVDSAWLGA